MSIEHKSTPKPLFKTLSLAFCSVALFLPGCALNFDLMGIQGSGVEETQSFDVEPFDQVKFSGSGEYNIKCGEDQSVSVSFDDNLMEFVEFTVVDGKLKLEVSESYSSGVGLTVNITMPELKSVEVNGAGTANITNYRGEKLAIEASGATTIIAEGTTDSVEVRASGACSLKLQELVARNCSVEMSGAGSANVHATETLDAAISGVGSLKYKGDPEVTEQISGVGSVSKIQ